MSYDHFVHDLNAGIEGSIIAYGEKRQIFGVMLYVNAQRLRTIFVPASIISTKRQQVISFLRQKIREGLSEETHIRITQRGEMLELSRDN